MQTSGPNKQVDKASSKFVQALIVFFLLLLSITIPAVVITISMQSSDEEVVLDETPLNKKQGLPEKQKPDDGD